MASIDVHTLKVADQKASCRAVHFSTMGDTIFTGGTLGDFCALDAERACSFSASDTCVLWRHEDEESGVQVLHQLPMCAPTGPLLVTGHEDGGIRLWDSRLCGSNVNHKKACVMSWDDHEDYISGFDHHADGTTLLASSADCTLSIMDLRKAIHPQQRKEAFRQSDNQEDELLSVQVLKNGRKVVCGTQQGVLAVWSWGTWGDVSDRFPGHPASIDALLKVDEDTVLTGSSDGVVRLVQIHPDKLLGVLGDHDGFPIEKLQFNSSRKVVGSISHDNFIRLWDTQMLLDDDEDDDEGEEEVHEDTPTGAPSAARAGGQNSDDDWSDGDNGNDEDEMDSDDSGDEREVEESANDRRSKKLKTDNEKFFEDL
jgi:WD repeat-containing protein 55